MVEFITEGLIPLLGMLMSFAGVIAIVYIVTRARQRRVEIQAELQSKLIEKFDSATELATFLHSPAGKSFVSGVQNANVGNVRDRVAAGYSRAITLSFLGAGFLAMWLITGQTGLAWPGVLLLALGLGYLVATLTTSRLSQSAPEITATLPPREV
ncbi:MAG: hypothetical protein NVSMB68_01680 [Thermoanaerobaculia bacterium]